MALHPDGHPGPSSGSAAAAAATVAAAAFTATVELPPPQDSYRNRQQLLRRELPVSAPLLLLPQPPCMLAVALLRVPPPDVWQLPSRRAGRAWRRSAPAAGGLLFESAASRVKLQQVSSSEKAWFRREPRLGAAGKLLSATVPGVGGGWGGKTR